MRKTGVLLFFILFTFTHARSQEKREIDSLLTLLQKANTDTQRVNILISISKVYWFSDIKTSISYSGKALTLSLKSGYLKGQGGALNSLGNAFYQQGEYKKSFEFHEKALAIRKRLNAKSEIAASLNNIGNCYNNMSEYQKAIDNYKQCLSIDSALVDKNGMAADYNNIGNVYGHLGDYEKSLQCHLNSLKLKQEIGDKFGESQSHMNIGTIYKFNHDFAKSLKSYQEALKIGLELDEKYAISYIYFNIGSVYFDRMEYDTAMTDFLKALSLSKEVGDKTGIGNALTNIGKIKRERKQYKEALKDFEKALELYRSTDDMDGVSYILNTIGFLYEQMGNFDLSIQFHMQSLEVAQKTRVKETIKDCYDGLYKTYRMKSDFRKALEYHELYMQVNDSLYNENANKQMTETQTKYETEKKDKEIILKDSEIKIQQADSKQKSLQRNAFIIGFGLMMVLAIFIFRSYRQKQKANIIITKQKEEVEKQRNLIEEQKVIVEHQKDLVEEKNKEVMDSIYYARRIQRAVITSDAYIAKYLSDFFVFYNPKDIVSGDFYWALEYAGKFYFITADCTGHGVPGAFMSLLNISILNEVVIEKKISGTDNILNEVRRDIIKALNPNGTEETKDGMDCILCSLDIKKKILEYSAANNSFYIARNNELIVCAADKMPVGKSPVDHIPFTTRTVNLQKGDVVYTLTDGLPDQFGGPKGKKFKYKQLEEILLENAHLPMTEQKQALEQRFNEWKGNLEQVDDVLLIGIRV